ncbi:hypothetical protein ADJ70_02810 [Olsenella sp. oral taxon 807]|uniref:tyrosine-type recombinase/integrase n=1 Tax=Olsenella sp. oral taxon 807 TaxID=712411 RepID=UPI000679F5C3|nr:tyrosine-type recombinase/integrase [Olsenella sp. oral taxon 807]AKT48137.1 hypothetical protein ADJ70_02810 [Olsenella sp. oral taxon 807]
MPRHRLSGTPPGRRDPGPNTIASYRDASGLPVDYFGDHGKEPESTSTPDPGRHAVRGFLEWPAARGNSDGTADRRPRATGALAGCARGEGPARLLQYQQVLAMRQRKGKSDAMVTPGRDGLAAILRDPGMSTSRGRRDTALLTVPCDSAARVSELCGITLRDLRLDDPAVVTLRGKGRKVRTVPLMHATAGLLREYVSEAYPGLGPRDLDKPLFPNPRGDHLTRAGVADILARHADGARKSGADIPEGVSPHSFRHQRAIDLLESGVNLVYIRDLLGHRSVTTTEIYATVSTARKRELLEKAATAPRVGEYPDWTADKDLMAWLKALC